MKASLVLIRKDGSMTELPLRTGRAVLGRDTECNIRVPLPQISRRHCEFIAGESGVSVRDLGSSNGVYVNGQRVSESELGPGDVVALGPCIFVVRVNDDPARIDAAMIQAALGGAHASLADSNGSSAGLPTGVLDELRDESDDSSVLDFDFEFEDDDDDDQPAL